MKAKRKCKPLKDRLMAFVSVDEATGCWNWTGAINGAGYGTVGVGTAEEGKDFAHRVSWRLFRGQIPDGNFVCHHCDNKLCINPDHLFTGTHQDNLNDAVSKGRMCSGQRWHESKRDMAVGESHGRHVLTETQVREIFRRYHEGERGYKKLANEFCVSRGTIFNIVKRRNWKHVTF